MDEIFKIATLEKSGKSDSGKPVYDAKVFRHFLRILGLTSDDIKLLIAAYNRKGVGRIIENSDEGNLLDSLPMPHESERSSNVHRPVLMPDMSSASLAETLHKLLSTPRLELTSSEYIETPDPKTEQDLIAHIQDLEQQAPFESIED